MPKIVQFLHTAVEATPISLEDNEIPWNNNTDHRRKFILSEGSFADKESIVNDQLAFWGEWEAQSKIERLNETRKYLPKLLNKPFIDPGVPNRTHNTDPYVFGESFRYIVCKQGHFELLRKLEPFSLILFGSSINHEFCLDTLFLVSNDVQYYSLNNIETIFNKRGQYYYASVNPLYDDTNYNEKVNDEDSCRLKPNIEYASYKGVNYEERDLYRGIYSYVPCKKFNGNKIKEFIFKQPAIKLDFINGSQTQGINACGDRNFQIGEILEFWQEITNQVEAHGLLKGINFKTPELRNNQAIQN